MVVLQPTATNLYIYFNDFNETLVIELAACLGTLDLSDLPLPIYLYLTSIHQRNHFTYCPALGILPGITYYHLLVLVWRRAL